MFCLNVLPYVVLFLFLFLHAFFSLLGPIWDLQIDIVIQWIDGNEMYHCCDVYFFLMEISLFELSNLNCDLRTARARHKRFVSFWILKFFYVDIEIWNTPELNQVHYCVIFACVLFFTCPEVDTYISAFYTCTQYAFVDCFSVELCLNWLLLCWGLFSLSSMLLSNNWNVLLC